MKRERTYWMLCLASDHWSLVSAVDPSMPGPSGAWSVDDAPALADAIAGYVAEAALAPDSILISLDGSLCLATQFTVASARQLRKRDALLFQLEETLPVSAEEIVADFLMQQRSVFAVTAETAALEPVVVELTRAGIEVAAIVPEVVLATEEHLQASNWPVRHGVLWLEPAHWELVTIDDRKSVAWERLPAESNALVQSLRAVKLATGESLPLVAYGSAEMVTAIQAGVEEEWLCEPENDQVNSLSTQASRTAMRVLDGSMDPPLQLLRGQIATSVRRKNPLMLEWRLVQCAAALLLFALAVTQFRAWQRAEWDLAVHVAGQADLFRELYPDKRVPTGIQTRLASDLRRLRGVRGDTTKLPSATEALEVVRQVLIALPAEMRFRLLEIRVENGRLSLSGEVRSHGDADRIAAALRKQGLRVSSPSTQQLPQQGVDFRLTADVAPAQEKSA